MTNNQYRTFCIALLLTGLSALPFLSFSQQQEEPKRVTVVVTAKELIPQKEIVQIPADNLPAVVSTPPKKVITVKRNTNIPKITIAPKVTPKETVAAIKNTAPRKTLEVKKKPAAVAEKELPPVKKVEIAKAEFKQKSQAVNKSANAPTAKAETTAVPDFNVSKEVKQIGDEIATTIKLETGDKEVVKLTHNSKVNSFSYVWIGIFLIVAGVVLGLLFGKPAFLISFVGVVFITLGLII